MKRKQAEALSIGDIVTLQENGQYYMVIDPQTRKVAKPERPQRFRVTSVDPIHFEPFSHDESHDES
jgi:hypothetical protein